MRDPFEELIDRLIAVGADVDDVEFVGSVWESWSIAERDELRHLHDDALRARVEQWRDDRTPT